MTRPLAAIEDDIAAAADRILRKAPGIGDTGLADALGAAFPALIAEYSDALAAADDVRTRWPEAAP